MKVGEKSCDEAAVMNARELVDTYAPNLSTLFPLPAKRWKRIEKNLEKRNALPGSDVEKVAANIFDIIRSAVCGNVQARAILEYTEGIAQALVGSLPDEIKMRLMKNGAQIFDAAIDGKQVFFERVAELRLLQQFATQPNVEILGIDVQMPSSEKDIDLVVRIDDIKYYLEFVSIRLAPEKIESKSGVVKSLTNRVTKKEDSKLGGGIPQDGDVIIIPTVFTNIDKLAPYKDLFQTNVKQPFAGRVLFFYMAYSGWTKTGEYVWGIDEAYEVLSRWPGNLKTR